MAKSDRNPGWPGFFQVFTVLCAMLLLLAQEHGGTASAVYRGLTLWSVPALFMLCGMCALEDVPASAALTRLALPALGLLVFWGAACAVAGHLLGGGALSAAGVWSALVSAAKGNTAPHLWLLYPLIGLYLIHPVIWRFTSSASQGELRYFLILCFLFASLLPLWGTLRPESALAAQLERLRLVPGWAGCYVGGWYLRHFTISRVSEYLLYLLGALGLALTLMAGDSPAMLQYTAPSVLLTAAALCTLFRYVLGVSEERSRRRALSGIGGCVPLPAALAIPLTALILFLLSLPFAWLFRRIPGTGLAMD